MMLVPLALFAAGIQGGGQTEPKPGMPMQGMSMMNCPMNLQGTTVAVADTATGISVSITTKPENVAERVRLLKREHQEYSRPATILHLLPNPSGRSESQWYEVRFDDGVYGRFLERYLECVASEEEKRNEGDQTAAA